MKRSRLFASVALVVGMAIPGGLSAADWDRRDRDLRIDYARVDRLRADIAHDQWRLDQDIRAGRRRAAYRDERDLERDQQALNALLRDIHHDRRDLRHDDRGRY